MNTNSYFISQQSKSTVVIITLTNFLTEPFHQKLHILFLEILTSKKITQAFLFSFSLRILRKRKSNLGRWRELKTFLGTLQIRIWFVRQRENWGKPQYPLLPLKKNIILEGTVPWKKSVKLMVTTRLKSDAQRKAYQQHQIKSNTKKASNCAKPVWQFWLHI